MARQMRIAGTEGDVDKDIAIAGEAYVTERDKRMKLTKREKAAKDALIAIMMKKKVPAYRDDEANPPVVITLTESHNVKVTRVDENEDDENDSDEKAN